MDDLKERLRKMARERSSRPHDRVEWAAAARIAALEEQLAGRDAEIAASRRVVYLLQWSGDRFNKAIRAIQADCPLDIAKRIDKALADNAVPPIDGDMVSQRFDAPFASAIASGDYRKDVP